MRSEKLNVEAVLRILDSTGPLASSFRGFEVRKEQKAMMRNILDAYHHNHIALIEAGTGTGKSLAYLIPAMLWAVEAKERTVISTNTINLQEQLLHKDIPLVDKALNLNLKAVLVKGMHNYLCLKKFEEAQQELPLLAPQEAEEIKRMEPWQGSTRDGSRSSLPFSPSLPAWEKVAAESDTCNRNSCPYFSQCYFFKARRHANEAQILIVNHHLLFADLVHRSENELHQDDPAILPGYHRIILDEAHNIEDIATDYFASRVSQLDLMRLTARLASEKKGKVSGKLPAIKEKIANHYKHQFSQEVTSILNRLTTDLPGLRRDLLQGANDTFAAFCEFVQSSAKNASDEQENKLRIIPHHHANPIWQRQLMPLAKQLVDAIRRYVQALAVLIDDISRLKDQRLDEQIKSNAFEIHALARRLEGIAATIEQFSQTIVPSTKVRWIELQNFKTLVNAALVDADLDISKILAKHLFSKLSTVVLCSATLTTNRDFQFFRNRLGLTSELLHDRTIQEHVYHSPFDFKKQSLLAIPTDLPLPTDPSFTSAATDAIWQAVQCSRGNAFVLFTSYTMLKSCFQLLESKLREGRFYPLKQGDEDRHLLLEKFKQTARSVLFGTDSFWEGVDVAGDALRCVIIVKLPFRVPSEPLIQARSEAIAAKGGDPFTEYSLPQAIVKFKQGFGRLIRHKQDRGCILCLDKRLITKHYGKLFLNSLPECGQVSATAESLQLKIKDFYRSSQLNSLT